MVTFGNFLADHLLILLIWAILINLILYALCGEDENRAAHKKPRYPFWLLLIFALIGGAFGGMIGAMRFSKKKSGKRRARLWLILALIQEGITVYALCRSERSFLRMLQATWGDLTGAFHRIALTLGWAKIWIAVLLLILSVIAFLAFGFDKRLAIRQRRRVSEAALIFLTVIGGAIGAMLGMNLFRHKTRHPKFTVTVSIFAVFQLFLLAAVLFG